MSRSGWRRLLEPRIFVPLLLSAALLIFALSLSDLPRVADRIRQVSAGTFFDVMVLAAFYLGVKLLLFHVLLAGLDIHPSWRRTLLAFAVGEMTLTVPSGIYAQNYVLRRLGVAGFARSAAATTAILAGEGLLVALALALVGIPGWPWAGPAALGIVAGLALVLAGLFSSRRLRRAVERLARRPRHGFAFRGLLDLADGLRSVATPRLAASTLGLGAVYFSALVAALAVVAHGTGHPEVGFVEALSIYSFSLGMTLLLGGILAQLGVIEVAGLAAARAWGIGIDDALGMLLAFRIAWMGSVWLLSGAAMAALWGEFQRSEGDSVDHGGQEAVD